MKARLATISWACTAALTSATAFAADLPANLGDLSLEQLMELNVESVYGASRYEQRVTEAPSSISIVTADEIRRFGYTSFEDVLRGLRGLYVTGDHNYSYLGIRGFQRPGDYNTRVLVLVDGHRMNDNVYDAGPIGSEAMLDVSTIDRVEVIRGPSSSVYGSSAFFGVINVITKHGRNIDGVEIGQDVGSQDTYRSYANYGATFANGIDWLASASRYTSAGMERLYYPEFDQRSSHNPRARNDGLAIRLDDEEAAKFFTSLRGSTWSASAYYSQRNKQVPTASYETLFADPENRTKDVRAYLDLTLDETLSDELRYRARVFYDYFSYRGVLPYAGEDPGYPAWFVNQDSGFGEWLGTELQLTAKLSPRYTFVVGTEYRANFREDQVSFNDIEPRDYELDYQSTGDVLGVFAQGEAKLRDDFTLTAGLRYDRYRNHEHTTNPRFAAIYNPTPTSALKLLYGEAFRAPNPYERYYYYVEQRLHPTLEPETIRTYELVYEHYLGRRYRLSLSSYYYVIDGLISQQAAGPDLLYFDNVDAVHGKGMELELEGKYASGAILRVSYALQRAKDDTTHRELTSSPHQLAKLALSLPVLHTGLFSNLELQYYDSSRTLGGATTSSFLLTNLSITTGKHWPGVELSAAINNVFDAKQVYPAAEEHLQDTLQLNNRTYMGKLVVRF